RLAGARVIATSRSASKLARLHELGASETIDTRATPEWEREVVRMTGGRGADIVVDVIGGSSLGRSIGACRVGGLVVLLGFLDSMSSTLDLPLAIRRSVTVRTSSGRSRESFEALVRAIAASGLRPVVDRVFDFDQVAGAFSYL